MVRQVEEALCRCGISELSGLSPHKLSYGQKHLVALSSLLVYRPQLLLLDDPFAGLDHEKTQLVMEILFDLSEKEGTTIIWTSHHPDLLSDWAHFALYAQGGQIVAEPV